MEVAAPALRTAAQEHASTAAPEHLTFQRILTHRVAPDIVRHLEQQHADLADFPAIGRIIAPWGRRIGDLRFETDGAWKRSGSTVDQLVKELRLALQYPEGSIG